MLKILLATLKTDANLLHQTAVSRGLSTLVTTFDVTDGGFELDNASADGAALNTAAVLLLPVLFKIVSDTHAAVVVGTSESIEVDEKSATSSEPSYVRLQCVTEAISAMARLASEDFVSGLFKKIMHRLLEEIQSESGEKEKVCSLLTLSQALVASKVLDDSSISFLYRALKPLIMNDEEGSRVQKRAYKVLSEICEQNHPFIADVDRLKETTALLTDTVLTSQISARYMRLKCLNIIIEGFDETHAEQLVSLCRSNIYKNSMKCNNSLISFCYF